MQPPPEMVLKGTVNKHGEQGSKQYQAHVTRGARSAVEALQSRDVTATKEAMADMIRKQALDSLRKRKSVKMIDAFKRSFGTGKVGRGLVTPSHLTPTTSAGEVCITGLDDGKRPSIKAFSDLKALKAPSLLPLALQGEGWKDPTPIQSHLWLVSQSNRDTVSLAAPGSGKTAAYLIPAILKCQHLPPNTHEGIVSPTVLILVPTVELARQVYQLAQKLCNPSGVLAGLVAGKQGQLVQDANIIIATPFRLKRLIRDGLITLNEVKLLIVDEADYMLKKYCYDLQTIVMRKERSEALAEVAGLLKPEEGMQKRKKKRSKKRREKEEENIAAGLAATSDLQLMLVASTWSTETAVVAEALLSNPVIVRVGGEGALPSVGHRLHVVPDVDRGAFIANMFTTEVLPLERNQYIIFAQDVRSVELLYDMLNSLLPYGTVAMVHEGMMEYQRKLYLDAMSARTAKILVATDLISRGIHFDAVHVVVNYDIPPLEVLLQRLGRTGRGESYGMCHTLVTPDTPRDVLVQLKNTLHKGEYTEPIADLLKGDNEKSTFVKKLEMRALSRGSSFDEI
eukprot:TRINITY_DN12457_c0_g1_i1.p1 TRINITY_DN12457_c0_g1~~TRINITY_DN12457_c0_g1_i1.p1  ORF type:complete len:632 (+),score=165.73 TRINITY_DN12457_c0_g1_i1:198-1898(+)